jgi:hypothetical protein
MATKAQLAAAQKDIAAQRAKRGESTARAAAHARKVQPEVQHADVEADAELEAFMASLPGPGRVIVGAILGIASATAVGYGIGMIMSYALAGIATLTGSAALAFMLSAVVWILGIYATCRIGGYVGSKVFGSVVLPDGLVSKCCASLSLGFGGMKDVVIEKANDIGAVQRARAFTGAFTKPVQV